ncbi:hypothetical protein LINPERPRIM_LOCUS5138, partial [Linum perenne]
DQTGGQSELGRRRYGRCKIEENTLEAKDGFGEIIIASSPKLKSRQNHSSLRSENTKQRK